MKRTMKAFGLATIAAMGALLIGCSESDDMQLALQQQEIGTVTMTTTVHMPGRAATKALTDGGVKTFAAGDRIAVVYENTSSVMVKTESVALEAGDIAVDGKTATFSVTVTNPKANGALKFIYPAAMAKADGSVNYDALDNQDGTLATLAANLDFAMYDGNFSGLEMPASPSISNRLAIGKFTVKNNSNDEDLTSSVTYFTIDDGTNYYCVKRSAAAGPIYVAMQPISGQDITMTALAGVNVYSKVAENKTLPANKMQEITAKLNINTVPGILNGQFSVSSTKKVSFSKGNLQWYYGGKTHATKSETASTGVTDSKDYNGGVFIFAGHQWEICGSNNDGNSRREGNIGLVINSITKENRIDLFMYATSGCRYSNSYHYKPFAICNNGMWGGSYAYGPLTSDMAGTNADWGVFNAIQNGGNIPDLWRTLTKPEWEYLMNTRPHATELRGLGTVEGIRGLIILPDGWSGAAIDSITNLIDGTKPASINWAANVYTAAEWTTMEAAGAVFLPSAGTKDPSNNEVKFDNEGDGNAGVSYWTSSYYSSRDYAYAFDIGTADNNKYINWRFDHSSRPYGRSVRLVRDVQ